MLKSMMIVARLLLQAGVQPFNQKNRLPFYSHRVACLADYANAFATHPENGVFIDIESLQPTTSRSKKKIALTPKKDLLTGYMEDIEFAGTSKTLLRELKTRGMESWLYFSATSFQSYFKVKEVIVYGRQGR